MAHNFGHLVFTPLVKALQEKYGSRRQYARMETEDSDAPDGLGPSELAFLAEQDHFYVATVGETGWPYVQHRGSNGCSILPERPRMTIFMPVGNARTMDYNANDVGYVPAVAGHYVENTGDTDLVFLELFAAPEFMDVSLNNWLRKLPTGMVTQHLNLDTTSIKKIPAEKQAVLL